MIFKNSKWTLESNNLPQFPTMVQAEVRKLNSRTQRKHVHKHKIVEHLFQSEQSPFELEIPQKKEI